MIVASRAMLVAVLLFCPVPSNAQTNTNFIDGNKLFEFCDNFTAPKTASTTGYYCVGYVTAIADALRSDNNFCVPYGTLDSQLADIAKQYLRDHPEKRHLSAADLVVIALKEKFPCPQ